MKVDIFSTFYMAVGDNIKIKQIWSSSIQTSALSFFLNLKSFSVKHLLRVHMQNVCIKWFDGHGMGRWMDQLKANTEIKRPFKFFHWYLYYKNKNYTSNTNNRGLYYFIGCILSQLSNIIISCFFMCICILLLTLLYNYYYSQQK